MHFLSRFSLLVATTNLLCRLLVVSPAAFVAKKMVRHGWQGHVAASALGGASCQ
jgi:hypothetical protein